MGRKVMTAAKFNGGMILNADPSDLPDGIGVASVDTMASYDNGGIGGRYADIAGAGYTNVGPSGYITKDGVGYDLVHIRTTDKHLMVNGVDAFPFYYPGNPVSKMNCLSEHRNFALIGSGRDTETWYYGYPPHMNGTAVSVANDFLMNGVQSVQGHADSGATMSNFEEGAVYRYAISAVYDGYMHGPLSAQVSTVGTQMTGTMYGEGFRIVPEYYTSYIRVHFVRPTIAGGAVDDRITSINIYRSVLAPGLTDPNDASEFIQIAEITDASVSNYDDRNAASVGNSYANISGLDETQTFCTLNYSMAYEMNNFLFVADVGYKKSIGGVPTQMLPDGPKMLFRSMRGRPCQFRIITDFLVLPFAPVAITSFNTRLIVFGAAAFVVVNPESMIIEEIVHGYGIETIDQVRTTIQGVFFANKNNLFVYDGQLVIPIGTGILRITNANLASALNGMNVYSYAQVVASYGGIKRIVYSARINSMLFLYSISSANACAYVFSLDAKLWSVFQFGTLDVMDTYTDRANVLYCGGASRMSASTTVSAWTYVTRRFNFGDISQVKKIYMVNARPTDVAMSEVSIAPDDGAFSVCGSSAVADGARRVHDVMVKYAPSTAGSTLTAIEITYREMVNVK